MADAVNHPIHYGGEDNPYEAIKVIEAWGLGFNLGNTTKYIARAGFKDPAKELEDLKKAAWYLDHEIQNRQIAQNALAEQANKLHAEQMEQHETLPSKNETTTDLSGFHGTTAIVTTGDQPS